MRLYFAFFRRSRGVPRRRATSSVTPPRGSPTSVSRQSSARSATTIARRASPYHVCQPLSHHAKEARDGSIRVEGPGRSVRGLRSADAVRAAARPLLAEPPARGVQPEGQGAGGARAASPAPPTPRPRAAATPRTEAQRVMLPTSAGLLAAGVGPRVQPLTRHARRCYGNATMMMQLQPRPRLKRRARRPRSAIACGPGPERLC